MKKRHAPAPASSDTRVTDPAPTDEFADDLDDLLAVFGEVSILTRNRADYMIEQMNVVDARHKADLRENIRGARSLVKRRKQLLDAGVDGVKKRRVFVMVCRGCGQSMIVTSGPKGIGGKSTLSGGCHVCARGQKGSTTMEYAEMMGEVT